MKKLIPLLLCFYCGACSDEPKEPVQDTEETQDQVEDWIEEEWDGELIVNYEEQ